MATTWTIAIDWDRDAEFSGDDIVTERAVWVNWFLGCRDYEEGVLTLNLAGDNWVRQGGYSDQEKDTFDVYRGIRDITAAERGKFFFDREGKAVFWNRHHILDKDAVDASFNDAMTDMKYTFASLDQTKNEVIVTCHPRNVNLAA